MRYRTTTLCILIGCSGALWGQDAPLSIRVLNGSTGKPLAHQRLLLFGGATPDGVGNHQLRMDLTTNAEGVVNFTVETNRFRLFQVWPDFMVRCAPQVETFTTEIILTSGKASSNACNKAVTAPQRPGELTFYARQPTLREKMNW